ncbi:MAG: hypothetical protein U0800_12750 [Isosphaeraceae bacterium]
MVEVFIRERGVTPCPPRTADWSHKATANGYETPGCFLHRESNAARTPEQKLAAAKILTLLQDLCGSPHCTPNERFKVKQAAHQWFFGKSDFDEWCEMAGLCPSAVREKAEQILKGGWPQWRAKAGTGVRYEERKAYRARSRQRGLQ